MMRSHTNGELRIEHLGNEVELVGWVNRKRNLGSLVFIDLRDRYGITQVICSEDLKDITAKIKNEYVIQIKGIVGKRLDPNAELTTGEIEVTATNIKIVNEAKVLPFTISDDTTALEDTRLKYRYLDLRRSKMQDNLITRHKIVKIIRDHLDELDFVDIETPILTRWTPEGARSYLTPSRVNEHQFYALPQSPQLFKQLLMVSGFERYYQVAKCFRDEDLRSDRQPEFTQIDIETSFLSARDIHEIIEKMVVKIMKEVKGVDINLPLPRLSYHDAMNFYGSDKPDTRFDLKLNDLSDFFIKQNVEFFKDKLTSGVRAKAVVVPNGASVYSRKMLDELNEIAKSHQANGLFFLKKEENGFASSITKFFNDEQLSVLAEELKVSTGDLILIVVAPWEQACETLGVIRMKVASQMDLIDHTAFNFLWVVDFPLFEKIKDSDKLTSRHHAFTRPIDRDLGLENPENALAQAYDIVLNGFEIGGGSLRIYEEELQKKIFEIIGICEEEAEIKFKFLLEALRYGAPPHGGIALGLDRIVMLLTDSESIRDVIAFPKNNSAICLMTEAPNAVDDILLDELNISLSKK